MTQTRRTGEIVRSDEMQSIINRLRRAPRLTARIAIDKPTHQKVQILASKAVKFNGFDQIDQLTRFLIDDAWQEALNAGLVKESMLKAEPSEPTKGKKS